MGINRGSNARQSSIPLRCIVNNRHQRGIRWKPGTGPQHLACRIGHSAHQYHPHNSQTKKSFEDPQGHCKTFVHTKKLRFRRDEFNKKKAALPRLLLKSWKGD